MPTWAVWVIAFALVLLAVAVAAAGLFVSWALMEIAVGYRASAAANEKMAETLGALAEEEEPRDPADGWKDQ